MDTIFPNRFTGRLNFVVCEGLVGQFPEEEVKQRLAQSLEKLPAELKVSLKGEPQRLAELNNLFALEFNIGEAIVRELGDLRAVQLMQQMFAHWSEDIMAVLAPHIHQQKLGVAEAHGITFSLPPELWSCVVDIRPREGNSGEIGLDFSKSSIALQQELSVLMQLGCGLERPMH